MSACDLDAEAGTVTGIRITSELPGEKAGVEPPCRVMSAQPIWLEIAIWKASFTAPVLVTIKVRVVVKPGSVVRSAGVDKVAM